MTLRCREKGKVCDRESRELRNRILKIVGTKVKDGAVAGYSRASRGAVERFERLSI